MPPEATTLDEEILEDFRKRLTSCLAVLLPLAAKSPLAERLSRDAIRLKGSLGPFREKRVKDVEDKTRKLLEELRPTQS